MLLLGDLFICHLHLSAVGRQAPGQPIRAQSSKTRSRMLSSPFIGSTFDQSSNIQYSFNHNALNEPTISNLSPPICCSSQ